MLAIIAAVLFGLALLFQAVGLNFAIFSVPALVVAGLLCVGLHLAGVGRRGGSDGPVKVRTHWRRTPR